MTTTAPSDRVHYGCFKDQELGAKGAVMKIIGCDFHPGFQRIAMVDTETGELIKRRLDHASGEADKFYEALAGQEVRVGVESSGNRSEEHTSELQSRSDLVCRLLLEKKKNKQLTITYPPDTHKHPIQTKYRHQPPNQSRTREGPTRDAQTRRRQWREARHWALHTTHS